MKLILAIVALASLVQHISAGDLDGIQDATPIGIPLNNPSIEFGGVNNGDTALEEPNLSGYRPLYPPYFQRNGNGQQQTYYDKEYYSRGAQPDNFDARLDRTLKTSAPVPAPPALVPVPPAVGPVAPAAGPADDVQVYVVSLDSQSRPESVVQLQNQPQIQLQVPPQTRVSLQTAPPAQTQFQPQAQPQIQSRQYARGFSNFRTHQHTQSYFYSFKFPSS